MGSLRHCDRDFTADNRTDDAATAKAEIADEIQREERGRARRVESELLSCESTQQATDHQTDDCSRETREKGRSVCLGQFEPLEHHAVVAPIRAPDHLRAVHGADYHRD